MIQSPLLNPPSRMFRTNRNPTTRVPRRQHLQTRLRAIKEAWIRINALPAWVKQSVVIIMGAEAQTFISVFMCRIAPAFSDRKVDLFIRPDYHQQLHISWLTYYCCQEIEKVLWAYVLCKISLHLSNYLFLFMVVLLGYSIFGLLMFWWDFKRSELMWIDGFWTMGMMTWGIFKGYKEEYISKIKSIF